MQRQLAGESSMIARGINPIILQAPMKKLGTLAVVAQLHE